MRVCVCACVHVCVRGRKGGREGREGREVREGVREGERKRGGEGERE